MSAERAKEIQRVEAVAKAIFWQMRAIMHDHADEWRKCDNKVIYRDCAKAAIVALAHY